MSSGNGRSRAHTEPRRDRPHVPAEGYLTTKGDRGMLAWRDVSAVLERATRYWLATTDRDGRPHLVQQWGAWLEDRLYFEGSPRTRWARNLARDTRVAFGADRGPVVVAVEGAVEQVSRPERALAQRIAKTYGRKYARTFGYKPTPEQWKEGGLWAARATKVLAWDLKDFGRSMTRFVF